jgi:hypothetical protein
MVLRAVLYFVLLIALALRERLTVPGRRPSVRTPG